MGALLSNDRVATETSPRSGLADTRRLGGAVIGAGAVVMLVGAGLWMATGTDIAVALHEGAVPAYLADVAEVSGIAVANLSAWLVGATMLGVGGSLLADVSSTRPAIARAGRAVYTAGIAIAAVAFLTWLALVTQFAPHAATADPVSATALAWLAWNADEAATVLLVGLGPALVSAAGHGDWVPTWLVRWGALALVAGVLAAVSSYVGAQHTWGMLIVPVGIGWTIAASVVALRTAPASS